MSDYQAIYDAIRDADLGEHMRLAVGQWRDNASAPHVLMRPRVYIDGNQWIALYGDNIEDGVVGTGDSPADAMASFDRAWFAKLPSAEERQS